MNDRMGEALGTAVQEYAISQNGRMLDDYRFWVVMKASIKQLGGDGFDRRTLWRALEIATEEKEYMGTAKLKECDPDIFKHGEIVHTEAFMRCDEADKWCETLRLITDDKIDWYHSDGRVVFKRLRGVRADSNKAPPAS